jgi:hypothetical protein
MKKLMIIAFAVLGMAFATPAQVKYEQSGNTFKRIEAEKTIKKGAEPLNTGFTWEDSKGNKYPIWISNGGKGSAYIIRTSQKTGKVYKAYLGKEMTQDIKKQLKIEE